MLCKIRSAGARRYAIYVVILCEQYTAVSLNAEVAVDTAGDAAAARLGDLLALINSLSRRDEQRAVVLIIGHIAVVVVDDDNIAHRALITGEDDASAVGSVDRRAARAGDVDALVVSRRAADAGVAVTKARGDAARARPAEAAGRVPGRADLRAAGARLGHRVGERDGNNK